MSRTSKQAQEELSQLNGAEVSAPIITNDQTIEPVVNLEIADPSNEQFMNEYVEVTVQSTAQEDEEPHVLFNVNGINQVFFRDVPTRCRRMFVEVLARCKQTKYKQEVDPYDITRSQLNGRTALVYPFTVNDPNPKGRAWLKAVMSEAA